MLTRHRDGNRMRFPDRGHGMTGVVLGIALALVLAACSPGGPATTASPAASPSTAPTTAAVASPSPSASETPSAPPSAPPATPTPTTPVTAVCRSAGLAARVTQWEGAAGHRIAHVTLTNRSKAPCLVRAISRPQLVDGIGSVVIDGAAPAASAALVVAPGGTLTTLVEDGNYCKATPIPPVSVAFVLPSGAGRVVAAPVSSTDVGGVPPCLGGAGSAGSIEMKPWAP